MLAAPLIAPFGIESIDNGRSKRTLPGEVGETIDATLMLPEGETNGCGIAVVVVVGEGVLSWAGW
jgi:hypothetical protein